MDKRRNNENEINFGIINDEQQIERNERTTLGNKNDIKRQKKEQNLKKRKNNKFDFFYMICLTTTIGYFGKYIINIILNYILKY